MGWVWLRELSALSYSFIFLLQFKHGFGVILGSSPTSDWKQRHHVFFSLQGQRWWKAADPTKKVMISFLLNVFSTCWCRLTIFFLLLLSVEQGQGASLISRPFHGGARRMYSREDLQRSSVSAGHGPGPACGHKDPQRHFQCPAVGWLPASKKCF